ncbi:MAG: oxidase [Sphingomonas bacterium]|uniref:zinc-binding dehydrogenase n=1 Tax=Sphingomonas bacterium TaxID=1895847 RepID=UPI00262AEF64|nr:zinc-binding dehydrogenase [Sphingomonas bacterium]MDB5695898.1 oxidase [Sphingomonas bacterium]
MTQALELRSRVTAAGELHLGLEETTLSAPAPDEVVVRIEAAPINPSDLGLLLGPADLATMQAGGTADRPTLVLQIPPQRMGMMKARLDQSLPVGNEGAGTVIAAGENAQGLIGRKVGMLGGGMYASHRKLAVRDTIALPDGASAADGASMFVNPLTALAMPEVMRAEGHKGLIHTAAASNLGQMLNRIAIADGVPLVNIVRSADQAKLLRDAGATYVVDSTSADFRDELTDAVAATNATIAFDAIGGGKLTNAILHAMEAAASREPGAYSRYGSTTFKQVYIYGGLDVGPTTLDRGFGFAWSVSGFLLTPFLIKAGAAKTQELKDRVARELKTTFASHYTDTISLADALRPEVVEQYQRKATGTKYLIDPSR